MTKSIKPSNSLLTENGTNSLKLMTLPERRGGFVEDEDGEVLQLERSVTIIKPYLAVPKREGVTRSVTEGFYLNSQLSTLKTEIKKSPEGDFFIS